MTKVKAVIFIVAIAVLGVINIIYRIVKIKKKLDIVFNYQDKLVEFLNSHSKGTTLYDNLDYLNKNSWEVQDIIDAVGMNFSMINPILGVQYSNYQIIINGIDEITRNLSLGISLDEIPLMMSNCLGKYIGYGQRNGNELISYLKNPLIWVREGIRVIVGLPIYFIYWTGLIKYSSYLRIKSNILVKLIGFIIGILGFIGTIVTIVTGYEPFMNIITGQ